MRRARFVFINLLLSVGLFLGLLVCMEVGRRLGIAAIARHSEEVRVPVGVADGPVYALLALLIGFSFNGAAARFDRRRNIVAQVVGTISAAWGCIDLLPSEPQPAIRDGFRRFVDALLASYAEEPDLETALLAPPEVTRAQSDIWSRSAAACVDPSGEKARTVLLPALNAMFGAVDAERLARRIHPPLVIFVMLTVMAFAGSLFMGYGLASSPTRNWVYSIGVAATIATAMYVIMELEYPRLGLIRVSDMDRAIVELRATLT